MNGTQFKFARSGSLVVVVVVVVVAVKKLDVLVVLVVDIKRNETETISKEPLPL